MPRKDFENAIRVQRMLDGDCRLDDISRLLRGIRGRCFGIQSIKDIADLIAHEDKRDSGFLTEAIVDLYFSTRLHIEGIRHQYDFTRLPDFVGAALTGAFRTLSDADIKRQTGLKRGPARRLLKSAISSLVRKQDGTVDASGCSITEMHLIQSICGSFSVRPVYDADNIFRDFCFVLRKNNLLPCNVPDSFAYMKEKFALFVISLLHRLDITVPDGNTSELLLSISGKNAEDTLSIDAYWPLVDDRNIHFSTTIFSSSLRAEKHCESTLVASAVRANGIPENPATLDWPIELTSDWKLGLMALKGP